MKTVIFIALTIAALGAVGVTTAIMSSRTPAHVAECNGGHGGHNVCVTPPKQGIGGICIESAYKILPPPHRGYISYVFCS